MAKTKEQIQNDLNEARAEIERLKGAPPKEREAAEAQATKVRAAVKNLTVETVAKELTDVSLETGKLFANLSNTLTAKTKQIEELDLAIGIKERDLEELYGKETVGSSLALLIENHDQQQYELESDIAEKRQAWAEENANHLKMIRERDAELLKARTREEDEFKYKREQARRADETTWKNELEDKKRAETLRAQEVERNFLAREQALADREDEHAQALTRIAGIPAEIEAAVKDKVNAVTGALSRDHKHATELSDRDHRAALAAVNAQLEAVKAENSRLLLQVTDLGTKLNTAYEKNVELSTKALESASGQRTLQEMRDLQVSTRDNGSKGAKS